jgi:hypothetical protein
MNLWAVMFQVKPRASIGGSEEKPRADYGSFTYGTQKHSLDKADY